MAIINSVLSWLMLKRFHQIELFMKYPHEVQEEWLKRLLKSAENTVYYFRARSDICMQIGNCMFFGNFKIISKHV